ncbi:Glycosyltransferase [Quillaja saponaria]|uniref:Glycosyltransferase n=1 Tax=Quillaja saponaria TaxID=32244 RepID=A0AAD7PTY8_QUISA|nr:Glycosyltransferase [Quillaja saponaria]
MASKSEAKKSHVVLVPLPIQGHVNPFLKLAKLLHHKGFHITFVNTESNHNKLLESRGPNSLNGLPYFRFETIPDNLRPNNNEDVTQNIVPLLCKSASRNTSFVPFCSLLSKLNDHSDSNASPVTCIISEGSMSFAFEASEYFGLPYLFFSVHNACGFMSFMQCRNLMERGVIPLKDASYLTNGYLDTIIDWIPGMKNIHLRDLPSFYRTTDPNDKMLDFFLDEFERVSKASAIILLTFDALEPELLDALPSVFPKLYTIAPLQLLLDHTVEKDLDSIGSNLWKEEAECLQWLNSKDPNSVIYVSFGSVIVMTPQQLVELAWGLANSKVNFLWVIRPDLVVGETVVLPPEFLLETKDTGLIVDWCPQEQVLNHPAVGGFLTHCGWNSIIESISSGVPLICSPFSSDQPINRRYVCSEWGFGIEMDSNNINRDEVEGLVRDLIDGQKGKKLRDNVIEWKRKAEAATCSNGSSYLNLERLANEVPLLK